MLDYRSGKTLSLSDCVDRQLTNPYGELYDKCCYLRAMTNGKICERCFGLTRDQTMDVPGYIPQLEDTIKQAIIDNPTYASLFGIKLTEGKKLKIYSLDCEASYIKYFASVLALFSLLF